MSQYVLATDSFQIKYSSYRSGKHRVNIQPISTDLTECLYYTHSCIFIHSIVWEHLPLSDGNKPQFTWTSTWLGQCHGSSMSSSAAHRKGPDSIPGQSVWDLWQTKWHCDRFSFRVLQSTYILPCEHYSTGVSHSLIRLWQMLYKS
jgi:hypothetical protein